MTQCSKPTVLFLGKKDDSHCQRALDFLTQMQVSVSAHVGVWGDPIPNEAMQWKGDYIVSYLSRWVVPSRLIGRARIAAINFHPASPEYPGIGCNNFALYEGAHEYGVTCHHMAAQVDTGTIIAVKRFPIFPSDTVATLLSRTYDFQLVLFYEMMARIVKGEVLPKSSEQWSRKPFSRAAFNDLFIINPNMPSDEITRRVRATSYGVFQPQVQLGEYTFKLNTQ